MSSTIILILCTNVQANQTWNKYWRRLEPGYIVQQPLLAAPWDWGRQVMTGAMAEHEELETIKPKLKTIEQELQDIRETYIPQMLNEYKTSVLKELEEEINATAKKSYWKGFQEGALTTIVAGGLIFLLH